jgi:hypothetical protein
MTDIVQNKSRRLLLATMAAFALPASAKQPLEVIHQGPESADDKRNEYFWKLLDAALNATRNRRGDYHMREGSMMNGLRAVRELQSGDLNIIERSTDLELERTLRPIRIPLDKGVGGFRVFMIRRELQAQLAEVRTLEDLQRFTIGQSGAWSDSDILSRAGFKVMRGNDYEGLFAMLAVGRFDLFSRSVDEASVELEMHRQRFPELVIERNLLLYYPLPRYLFVRRDAEGEQLATRIEDGFAIMQKDGSFDRLFADYRAPFERTLNLKGRRLFRIANPLLSADTPLKTSELWYDPTK